MTRLTKTSLSTALTMVVVGIGFVLIFSGCETTQRTHYTASGRPEITIRAPLSAIKSAIVADLIPYGYSVEADSDYMLRLTRQLGARENIGAALTTGNSYSSNRRVTTYTFAQNGDEVAIVVSSQWEAQMPYGQVNRRELTDDNATFNTFQEQLRTIRDRLEAKPKG